MDSGDNYMVKTFIYKNNYYAYDAFTNTLMRVNKEIYLDINEYINLGEKEYRKNTEWITPKVQKCCYKKAILNVIK